MARTRHVFNSDMVAHVWAQQSQSDGRNPHGNFYFEGTTIYSYRRGYPVGNIVKGVGGKLYALIWNGKYSVTTSRHQQMAENAVRGKFPRFHVPDLLTDDWSPHGRVTDIKVRNRRHRENVAALTKLFEADLALLRKAAGHPTMDRRDYMLHGSTPGKVDKIKEYCKAFNVKVPAVVSGFTVEGFRAELDQIGAERRTKSAARQAKLLARYGGDAAAMNAAIDRKNTLSRAAKLRSDSWRLRRMAEGYVSYRDRDRFQHMVGELEGLVRINPSDAAAAGHLAAFNAAIIAMRERAAQQEAERLERQRVEHERRAREMAQREAFNALSTREARLAAVAAGDAHTAWLEQDEALEAWRAGAVSRDHRLWSAPTAMRVNGENVETSRGALFPVEHAKIAWRALRLIYARGEAWQSNGHSIRLGHFKLDRVEADGTVYAGCHVVARSEVERLAADLGLESVAGWLSTACADCVVSEHAYPLGQLTALGLV